MRKNVKRLAGLASIGVLLAVVGCDKAESDATKHDKKIANILDQGQRTLNKARLKLGDAALKSMDSRWRAAEAESLKASGQTLSPDQLRQRIPSLPDDAARRLSSPEIVAHRKALARSTSAGSGVCGGEGKACAVPEANTGGTRVADPADTTPTRASRDAA